MSEGVSTDGHPTDLHSLDFVVGQGEVGFVLADAWSLKARTQDPPLAAGLPTTGPLRDDAGAERVFHVEKR